MPLGKQQARLNSEKTFHGSSSIISRPVEVIPDSEEEREQYRSDRFKLPITVDRCDVTLREEQDNSRKNLKKFIEVIEISSDDSIDDIVVTQSPKKQSTLLPNTPKRPGIQMPQYSRMRIIESSDEDSDPDILEISDRSFEMVEGKTVPGKRSVASRVDRTPGVVVVDESIIIFDEPRSARTTIPTGKKKAKPAHQETVPPIPDAPSFVFPDHTPGSSKSQGPPSTPVSKQDAPRRNTKKAQLDAEQRRRHTYAQQLFNDLNEHVFQRGLPEGTKLNWNKRLLTTAGRAKYHRSRDGVQTTEIELAEKILDCDERIRNTLSHEMCHLATWIIDQKIDEHHGRLFKFWANRVMKKRPEIMVSIKHDYEISYPFNWECEKCAKTYGRFSKSIRPDECRCGVCKEGILVPLFKTRAPRNTPKLSRMAAAKPQDSPRAGQDVRTSVHGLSKASESEDDIEAIVEILALTTIAKH